MMAAAACTSVLASAGADVAHEMQGRFHDAMIKRQNTNNLQTFTGALGGIKADAVSKSSSFAASMCFDCPSTLWCGLRDGTASGKPAILWPW